MINIKKANLFISKAAKAKEAFSSNNILIIPSVGQYSQHLR